MEAGRKAGIQTKIQVLKFKKINIWLICEHFLVFMLDLKLTIFVAYDISVVMIFNHSI